MRKTGELDEVMKTFEREIGYVPEKYTRDEMEALPNNQFYPNGELNKEFQWYLKGYAFGKFVGRDYN